ncbi:MAG: N-acetyltransferase [Oscillospiraceae bacterium]|jgi:predicted GNAT family acetyltransferase|nr:N-acetyltransferase [Oscillospiraceae bacterium]
MAEFVREANAVYYRDADKTLAEILFPDAGDGVVNIKRTFVDESLAGQGLAGQLVLAAAEIIRARGLKTKTECAYAEKWFGKHPEFSDILVKNN